MRVVAISLLVAAPALVSAAVTPIRRGIPGMATWYITETGNAGACGAYLHDADYTVAMNQYQYDGMCGKTISITSNGKTTQAKVVDLCPNGGGNCNYGDVDMSPGLFSFFADQGAGKIPIDWYVVGEGDSAPPPPPEAAPTTTTHDFTPEVPSVPTTSTSITENYVAINEVAPTTTPQEVPAADPTPQPETISETPTTTESATPEATPTPTPPTLGEQLALAIKDGDVSGLGAALAELGILLQNSTTTTTT